MEFLMIIATVLGGLFALNLAALQFGADSRDPIGDDHRR